jgi:hypothetical protein
MNTINMPGFTAINSLASGRAHYFDPCLLSIPNISVMVSQQRAMCESDLTIARAPFRNLDSRPPTPVGNSRCGILARVPVLQSQWRPRTAVAVPPPESCARLANHHGTHSLSASVFGSEVLTID